MITIHQNQFHETSVKYDAQNKQENQARFSQLNAFGPMLYSSLKEGGIKILSRSATALLMSMFSKETLFFHITSVSVQN